MRLWEAIGRERRRRRRRRFAGRAGTGGITLFVLLTVMSGSTGNELGPLLGLADAVEAMPRDRIETVDLWYSRSERIELVIVPEEILAEAHHLEFLLPSVQEVWIGMGDTERRRTTYGQPEFFSPEDSRTFWLFDLSAYYPTDRTLDVVSSIGELAFFDEFVLADPSDVYAVLRRQVAGRGLRRAEEVEMLRLAARLMQTYGHDPVVRGTVLRVIADIPGIAVSVSDETIDVSFDYVDGDRPLRLSYTFDAETAYLVGESLAVLATVTEPSTLVSRIRYEPVQPAHGFVGS